MLKSLEDQRIETLEAALLEYVERYGPTELAMKAFSVSSSSNVVAPTKPSEHAKGEDKGATSAK